VRTFWEDFQILTLKYDLNALHCPPEFVFLLLTLTCHENKLDSNIINATWTMLKAGVGSWSLLFWNGETKTQVGRVDWLVTEHLSTQGRPDPRGRLCCFWCPNKTWTPPLGASDTRTIIGNRLEMRKLQPPQVKGQKLKKTDHRTLQRRLVPEPHPQSKGSKTQKNRSPNTTKAAGSWTPQKIPFMLLLFY
jgi:hypothetical protein